MYPSLNFLIYWNLILFRMIKGWTLSLLIQNMVSTWITFLIQNNHVFLFKWTLSSCSLDTLYFRTNYKCQNALYFRTEGVHSTNLGAPEPSSGPHRSSGEPLWIPSWSSIVDHRHVLGAFSLVPFYPVAPEELPWSIKLYWILLPRT